MVFTGEAHWSESSTVASAAKIPILAALRWLRHARDFASGYGVPKRLLISTEPSIPTIILGDDAAADKTLPGLTQLARVAQEGLCIPHVMDSSTGRLSAEDFRS